MALDTNGFPKSGLPILSSVSDRLSILGQNPLGADWEFLKPMTTDGFRGMSVGTVRGIDTKIGSVRASNQDYAGVWMSQTTPSVTNYSFLYASGSIFNTPTGTTMNFRVNNANRLSLTNTVFTSAVQMQGPNGSASAPTYSFTNSTNTGFYNTGSSIGISYSGTNYGSFSTLLTYQGFVAGDAGYAVSNVNDYITSYFTADYYSNGSQLKSGGDLSLLSNYNSDSPYADIFITAGARNYGTGDGGDITITSGTESDSNFSATYYTGSISILGGDASFGYGSDITIRPSNTYDGSGFSTSAGALYLLGGEYLGSSSGNAGFVSIVGGNAYSGGYGGSVSLQGGYSADIAEYGLVYIQQTGGDVQIGSSNQFYYNSNAGNFTVTVPFVDGSAVYTVDWSNRTLYDASSYPSIDWSNRYLYDSNGYTPVDWGNRVLYDTSSANVLDWATEGTIKITGDTFLGDGGTTNYAKFDSAGHLTFEGSAQPFDDLRVEPTARTTGANAPTFEKWYDDTAGTSRGVFLYSFDDATAGSEKEVFFEMQMPHSWNGGDIEMHIHWVGAVADTTSAPRWGMEYTWKDVSEVFGDTTIVYSDGSNYTTSGTDANITANKHYISKFASFTPGTTADGISSVLIGRLFRDSANAGDTYNATGAKCGLLYIDAHYQIARIGSDEEYTP